MIECLSLHQRAPQVGQAEHAADALLASDDCPPAGFMLRADQSNSSPSAGRVSRVPSTASVVPRASALTNFAFGDQFNPNSLKSADQLNKRTNCSPDETVAPSVGSSAKQAPTALRAHVDRYLRARAPRAIAQP